MTEMRNDNDVYKVLGNLIEKAIDETAGYVLGILQDYIYKDVYGNGNIPHEYVRTFEFLDSWITKVEKGGNLDEVVATIFSDHTLMTYKPETFTHGSYDAEWRRYAQRYGCRYKRRLGQKVFFSNS